MRLTPGLTNNIGVCGSDGRWRLPRLISFPCSWPQPRGRHGGHPLPVSLPIGQQQHRMLSPLRLTGGRSPGLLQPLLIERGCPIACTGLRNRHHRNKGARRPGAMVRPLQMDSVVARRRGGQEQGAVPQRRRLRPYQPGVLANTKPPQLPLKAQPQTPGPEPGMAEPCCAAQQQHRLPGQAQRPRLGHPAGQVERQFRLRSRAQRLRQVQQQAHSRPSCTGGRD